MTSTLRPEKAAHTPSSHAGEQPAPVRAVATVGRSGVRNTQLARLFMDDPLIKEFRGPRARNLIDRMSIDPIIAGALWRYKLLLRAAEWKLEPGGDAPIDQAFADFVGENIERLQGGWKSTVGSAINMLAWGAVIREVLFERDGGRIVWAAFSPRDPRTLDGWDQDPATDQILAVYQVLPDTFQRVPIPYWKVLHFRTDRERPEGESLFRGAFLSWTDKQELRRVIKNGIRRDLTGLLKIEVPPQITAEDASADEKAALEDAKTMGKDIERDLREFLVVPHEDNPDGTTSGWRVGLMTSGGRRSLELEAIWKQHNLEIAMPLLADDLLIGHEQVGSYSLQSDKTSMVARMAGAMLDEVEAEMRQHALPVLRAVNPQFQGARIPKWTHGDIEDLPIAEFFAALAQGVGAGAILPEPNLEQAARDRLGVPSAQGEEDI